jgi:hypothetical protein
MMELLWRPKLEKAREVNRFIAEKGWEGLEASLRERHHVEMGRAWRASGTGQWLPAGWNVA